jgi:hypothetical protein
MPIAVERSVIDCEVTDRYLETPVNATNNIEVSQTFALKKERNVCDTLYYFGYR